jgi:diaminopimelate epimerase
MVCRRTVSKDWFYRNKPSMKIEIAPLFPNRTNVQFMQIIDRANIRIEIWERGAGYTLASGSGCGPEIGPLQSRNKSSQRRNS